MSSEALANIRWINMQYKALWCAHEGVAYSKSKDALKPFINRKMIEHGVSDVDSLPPRHTQNK